MCPQGGTRGYAGGRRAGQARAGRLSDARFLSRLKCLAFLKKERLKNHTKGLELCAEGEACDVCRTDLE